MARTVAFAADLPVCVWVRCNYMEANITFSFYWEPLRRPIVALQAELQLEHAWACSGRGLGVLFDVLSAVSLSSDLTRLRQEGHPALKTML